MANYCSNNVYFEGSEEQLQNLEKAIQKSIDVRKGGNIFRFILLPLNYTVKKAMFDIDFQDKTTLWFQTKWSPDPVQIIQMCRPFGVNFLYSYEELGGSVYGEFQYNAKSDTLKDRYLSEEQIKSSNQCLCSDKCKDIESCDSQEANFDEMDRTLGDCCDWIDIEFDISNCNYKEK